MAFTVVIPTNNRPHFLGRLLCYYGNMSLSELVLVSDSSSEVSSSENQKIVARSRTKLNISYHRDQANLNGYLRITHALSAVDSEYAVICSDDDFIVPRSIEQSIRFLEEHPDYVIAHGHSAMLTLGPDATTHGTVKACMNYRQRSVELSSGSKRLLNHLANYSLTSYSVQRTRTLRRNWELATSLDLDLQFGELLSSCLSLIQGKSKKLDNLYMVRQSHSEAGSATLLQHTPDWIADASWRGQYERFHNCLAAELAQQDSIVMQSAKNVVEQAFRLYLPGCSNGSRLRRVAGMVPGARRVWNILHCFRRGRQDNLLLRQLLDSSSPYHDDFMPIYRMVSQAPAEFQERRS